MPLGEGLIGAAAAEARPVRVGDITRGRRFVAAVRDWLLMFMLETHRAAWQRAREYLSFDIRAPRTSTIPSAGGSAARSALFCAFPQSFRTSRELCDHD